MGYLTLMWIFSGILGTYIFYEYLFDMERTKANTIRINLMQLMILLFIPLGGLIILAESIFDVEKLYKLYKRIK